MDTAIGVCSLSMLGISLLTFFPALLSGNRVTTKAPVVLGDRVGDWVNSFHIPAGVKTRESDFPGQMKFTWNPSNVGRTQIEGADQEDLTEKSSTSKHQQVKTDVREVSTNEETTDSYEEVAPETSRWIAKNVDASDERSGDDIALTESDFFQQNTTNASRASAEQNAAQHRDTRLGNFSPALQDRKDNASITATHRIADVKLRPLVPQRSAGANGDAQPAVPCKGSTNAENALAPNTIEPHSFSTIPMQLLTLWRVGVILFILLIFMFAVQKRTATPVFPPRSKDEVLAEIYAKAHNSRLEHVSSVLAQNARANTTS